jgi:hypothetical protein
MSQAVSLPAAPAIVAPEPVEATLAAYLAAARGAFAANTERAVPSRRLGMVLPHVPLTAQIDQTDEVPRPRVAFQRHCLQCRQIARRVGFPCRCVTLSRGLGRKHAETHD